MGGVQHSTLLLAEYILINGIYDVNILLPNKGPMVEQLAKRDITTSFYYPVFYKSTAISLFNDQLRVPNPIAWIWNTIAILLNMREIKKKVNPYTDLIITKGLLNHLSSGIACKTFNIPIIWHLQDLITDRYFGLIRYLFNYFAKNIPNHIICDGQIIKDSMKKEIQNKSTVVLNGIKTDSLIRDKEAGIKGRNKLNIPSNAYVIGHLSRITPWKGQEILLTAFIEYSKQNPKAYLLLVGSALFDNDRYLKYLIKVIDEHQLKDRVIMPGYRTDIKGIYSTMDLFLYPALEKDTTPLALISAIASGLPVAISNIESLHEITGLCPEIDTFDSRSKDEIIFIMKKYENTNIRDFKGNLNEKSGREHFDISYHAMNMIQIFNKLLTASQ